LIVHILQSSKSIIHLPSIFIHIKSFISLDHSPTDICILEVADPTGDNPAPSGNSTELTAEGIAARDYATAGGEASTRGGGMGRGRGSGRGQAVPRGRGNGTPRGRGGAPARRVRHRDDDDSDEDSEEAAERRTSAAKRRRRAAAADDGEEVVYPVEIHRRRVALRDRLIRGEYEPQAMGMRAYQMRKG
jgi:hypothetical protein